MLTHVHSEKLGLGSIRAKPMSNQFFLWLVLLWALLQPDPIFNADGENPSEMERQPLPRDHRSLWGHQTTRQDKLSHTDPVSHGRAPGVTQHMTKEGQKMLYSCLQSCPKPFQPLFPACLTVWHCLHPSDRAGLCQLLPFWKLGIYLKLSGIYNLFPSYS